MATETRILDVSADPPFSPFVDQLNRAGFQEQSTFYYRQGLVAAGYSNEVENGFPARSTPIATIRLAFLTHATNPTAVSR